MASRSVPRMPRRSNPYPVALPSVRGLARWPSAGRRALFFCGRAGVRLGGSRRTQMYPFSRCLPLVQGAVPHTAPWRASGATPPAPHLDRAPRPTGTAPVARGQGHAQERAYETSLSPL